MNCRKISLFVYHDDDDDEEEKVINWISLGLAPMKLMKTSAWICLKKEKLVETTAITATTTTAAATAITATTTSSDWEKGRQSIGEGKSYFFERL